MNINHTSNIYIHDEYKDIELGLPSVTVDTANDAHTKRLDLYFVFITECAFLQPDGWLMYAITHCNIRVLSLTIIAIVEQMLRLSPLFQVCIVYVCSSIYLSNSFSYIGRVSSYQWVSSCYINVEICY